MPNSCKNWTFFSVVQIIVFGSSDLLKKYKFCRFAPNYLQFSEKYITFAPRNESKQVSPCAVKREAGASPAQSRCGKFLNALHE